MDRLARFMRIVQPAVLVALPIVMLLWAWLKLPNAALVTTASACVALVPFFVSFEKSRRRARNLMPVVILTALAVAGRLVFAPVPVIKPIIAIVVMGVSALGRITALFSGRLPCASRTASVGRDPGRPGRGSRWGS